MNSMRLFVVLTALMACVGQQFRGDMLSFEGGHSYKRVRHKRGYKAFKRRQRI